MIRRQQGVSARFLPVVLVAAAPFLIALLGDRGRLVSAGAADPGTSTPVAGPAAPAPIFCPRCGAANRAGTRFCTKDGTPLPDLDPARRSSGFVRSPGTFSSEEIQQVMNRVAASVVRIRVKPTTTYRYPIAYYRDEETEYYGGAMIGRMETSPSDARLSGSGFAIGAPGEIATNAHVARANDLNCDITIETQDGRSLPAKLVGVDPASDLALLKTEGAGLPPLEWGDSGSLKVGQEAWAIGNPLDIGISIARGTISGISGVRHGLNQVESFIHSDAHITHGNSGGPLVDVYGHVLGVSDMIASEEKGQGYSIPSRMARLVIDRLHQRGVYERGYLGLTVRGVDADAMRKFALKRPDGVLVESVLPGTPGFSAGMSPGDVLYGVNGRQTSYPYVLQEAVSSVGPGAPIVVMFVRGGHEMQKTITTSLRPAAPHIDPVVDWQTYLRLKFVEDPKSGIVLIRDPNRSRRAPGMYDGARIKSVLPAQDWPEELITLNYYKTRSHPVPIGTLDDLRRALQRSYVGGRMAATFEIDVSSAPITSIAFDEIWPIVL